VGEGLREQGEMRSEVERLGEREGGLYGSAEWAGPAVCSGKNSNSTGQGAGDEGDHGGRNVIWGVAACKLGRNVRDP